MNKHLKTFVLFRYCKFWRAFSRALHLLLNRALLASIFSFFKSFKYPPSCLEYSHHYWSKQSYARFFDILKAICNCLIFARTKSCHSNDLLFSLKRQLSFQLHLLWHFIEITIGVNLIFLVYGQTDVLRTLWSNIN